MFYLFVIVVEFFCGVLECDEGVGVYFVVMLMFIYGKVDSVFDWV